MAIRDLNPLENPMDLPQEFKSWLVKYLEVNPPALPLAQMLGASALPKTTYGAFSSGPPAKPSDGDIWVASTTGFTNFAVWTFRYNAASGSPYKWEFIGGAPGVISVQGYSSGFSLSAWTPFNGSAWGTGGQQGDFLCSGVWAGTNGPSAATYQGAIMANFGSGYVAPSIGFETSSPTSGYGFSIPVGETLVTANTTTVTLALAYWVNQSPGSVVGRVFKVVPCRIK